MTNRPPTSAARQLQDTSLRYFLEVVRCGSIAEASARLNVAGSAISRHISQLEDLLGVALFERRPRGMVPSAAGELLAHHAIQSAHDAERVAHDIQALQGGQRGRVRVATSEGFAMEFMPQLIAAFVRKNPGVQFHLDVLPPAGVSRRIVQGEADIGVTFTRAVEKDIRAELVQPAPIYAVMRHGHPLAHLRRIGVAQMLAYPLALPTPDTTVRQLFDIACSHRRLAAVPALTSNYIAGLFGFLRDHDGMTIAGELSIRRQVARGELVALPLRDPGMALRNMEVQTLMGRELPRAAQTFLNDLKAELTGQPSA
ncbi:MAG: HTH-type transcriptional regulator CynR [Paracidovorax wautersii]|uniref:HTH-type transcriptional regulator CynR n=1 Tax=Paracidovorax wautersii TaxID=1177982 RepID=A0A7V8FML0_9BURK|nr:MAG: HTH-type transcriptional regulator CynR [Paracidovorax wautersii]